MVLFTSFNDPVFISKDKFKWCNSSSDATVLLMIKANVSGYTRCGVDSHLSRKYVILKKLELRVSLEDSKYNKCIAI